MHADELRRRRATAQCLHRPAVAAGELIQRLLAVQAQDHRAAPLALRARATGLSLAAVDAARERAELVVTWLMRGTLHLVTATDVGWLHALTAPRQEAAARRRLAQLGVADDADRAVAIVERAVSDGAPHSRGELVERLAAAGIATAGQAGIHLLALAARRGAVVLGPVRDGAPAYVSWPAWLGVPRPLDVEEALTELARRYLRAHGPATDADLATWSGLPLREARRGLRGVGAELLELPGGLLVLQETLDREFEPTAPRLLPAFDPYLLGWRDRTFAVPAAHARQVAPGGGVLRATGVVAGRAVATWGVARRNGRLAVTLEPFVALAATQETAFREDAAAVARFEGLRPGDPF